jgi:cysteine desulfurase
MDYTPWIVSGPVYLDNGATTRVDPRVAEAAARAMTEAWGNPSSAHTLGVQAARLLAAAREQVARAIGADPAELTFTSGGTEANALGLLGAARAARGRHVVVSAFEHPSILDAAKKLAQDGWQVTELAPEPNGVISVEKLAEAVRADTSVVCLMWVQNELGTVQPVEEAARAVKARAPRCHVHVDAVQAVGKLAVDVQLGFDSLVLSAHKIHGPKGVGALWLRKGARVQPLVFGGGQERGLRPGTENMPGIVALGLAVELAVEARAQGATRMSQLRDQLWQAIAAAVPGARRHGAAGDSAPHILSVGFPRAPAEPLLHAMEARGVCVSAGSACHAKDKKPSPTLKSIGVPDDMGTLRFSFSRDSVESDVNAAVTALRESLAEVAK